MNILYVISSFLALVSTTVASNGAIKDVRSLNSRLWLIDINPTHVGNRIDPKYGRHRRVTYARIFRDGSFIAADGAIIGTWRVRPHPYELLERIPDDVMIETNHRGLHIFVNGRLWDRHLPPGTLRRITHGVITVQGTRTSPRVIVATFRGREATEREEMSVTEEDSHEGEPNRGWLFSRLRQNTKLHEEE